MRVGRLAGRDGVPKQRRKHWLESAELAHDAALDQFREVGQQARIEQSVDDLPVGAIPPDQGDTASERIRSFDVHGRRHAALRRFFRAAMPTAPSANKASDEGSGTAAGVMMDCPATLL